MGGGDGNDGDSAAAGEGLERAAAGALGALSAQKDPERAAPSKEPGQAEAPAAARPREPTHMLLFLANETFVGSAGDRLADEVRVLRATNFPVVLLHEKNSCEFGHFFQTTPADLIADGLYKMVALELLPSPHDAVSAVHLAKAVGAKKAMRGGGLAKRPTSKFVLALQSRKSSAVLPLPPPAAAAPSRAVASVVVEDADEEQQPL